MSSLKEWSFERCTIALFGNHAQNNGELKRMQEEWRDWGRQYNTSRVTDE